MSNYAVYYHPDTVNTSVKFDTTRKGALIAKHLQQRGVTVQQPMPLTEQEAKSIHTAEYVDAIMTGEPLDLAESQRFNWDAATWRSVSAQNGAMRDATLSALAGIPAYALSAGFHHARTDTGAGFCTFNGVALAAAVARTHGVRRIIILDVDAHHGGGTYSIVHGWPEVRHIDISTSRYDAYKAQSPHHVRFIEDADDYIPLIQQALDEVGTTLQPDDFLIHNAGMDPYEYCTTGGLAGITKQILVEREALIARWAVAHQLRRVACLAGGYHGEQFSKDELSDLHCMSVRTFLQIDGE